MFNDAFKEYWNTLWIEAGKFSFMDMAEAIQSKLQEWHSPYFKDIWELGLMCSELLNYLMHVPKAILPESTDYYPQSVYIPAKVVNVHFRDTIANLTSFSVEYEHMKKNVYDELEFTKQIEKEAKEAEERKDGTVYILHYREFDKRRICPYRYTLIASASWKKHVRIITYDDSPVSFVESAYRSLVEYFEFIASRINFYDNYREGNCNFDENPTPNEDVSDLPF